MLTIPAKQWTQLQALQSHNVEQKVQSILHHNFTHRYQQLTAEQVADFIHQGHEKAKRKGITRQQSICQYIILMFVFGPLLKITPIYFGAAR